MLFVLYKASFDKNGVMIELSVKLCTFLWSLYAYSHGNTYL